MRRNQRLRREERQAVWELGESPVGAGLSPELKAAMILFFSLLDEQQRRLYAGLEAQKLGYGGDRKIAEFFGVDVHTVARGRRELFGEQVHRERVRKEGGGRKACGKKTPKVIQRIADLLKHETAGDPMQWFEMDSQDDPEGRPTTAPTEHPDQRQNGGPSVERDGLLVARQSQEPGIWQQEPATTTGAQPAVSIHQPETERICLSGEPDYQRRHEKEGEGREIQKSWGLVGAEALSGE